MVASGAGLGFVLPIARRHIKQPPPLRTGSAALVGRSAHVLEEVTMHGGRVRIGGVVARTCRRFCAGFLLRGYRRAAGFGRLCIAEGQMTFPVAWTLIEADAGRRRQRTGDEAVWSRQAPGAGTMRPTST